MFLWLVIFKDFQRLQVFIWAVNIIWSDLIIILEKQFNVAFTAVKPLFVLLFKSNLGLQKSLLSNLGF